MPVLPKYGEMNVRQDLCVIGGYPAQIVFGLPIFVLGLGLIADGVLDWSGKLSELEANQNKPKRKR